MQSTEMFAVEETLELKRIAVLVLVYSLSYTPLRSECKIKNILIQQTNLALYNNVNVVLAT